MSIGMAVILKPTYKCNAMCDYCEIHKLGNLFKPMTKEIFVKINEKLVKYFENKLEKNQKAKVTFYWLGGEPLLVGDDFYKEILNITEFVDKNLPIKPHHVIQTNLIAFGEKKFPYLKKLLHKYAHQKNLHNTYSLNTSFDPVSDARKLKNKKDYNVEFMRALKVVKSQKASYGAVYTVHKGSLNKEREIYNFFKNLGFSLFNINAMCDYSGKFKESDFDMTPKEFGEFLKNMWDIWEGDKNSIKIIPFDSWKYLKEERSEAKLRCFNNGLCDKTLCAIGPNGDVFTCDRAMQANQKPFGNILKDDFEDMFKKKYHQKRVEYLKENDCKDCKWWDYCKGSCPYESRDEYEGSYGKSFWCEGYKMLFEYINSI